MELWFNKFNVYLQLITLFIILLLANKSLAEYKDGYLRAYVNYYRDAYQYNFAYYKSFCDSHLIACPIELNKLYTIDVNLFIPYSSFDGSASDRGLMNTTVILN
jgi:hypothetical protein